MVATDRCEWTTSRTDHADDVATNQACKIGISHLCVHMHNKALQETCKFEIMGIVSKQVMELQIGDLYFKDRDCADKNHAVESWLDYNIQYNFTNSVVSFMQK
ncbi:uncharacterized protein LOC144411872 [Styela clava]